MIVTSASATATVTADEIIVGTALGGSQYRIGNFSKTINLATTGAGGIDTGSAPSPGFVGIYAIYNPVTNASALLAVNATSAIVPEVYGGANMPAGYTASALVNVWPVVSGQLNVGIMVDREISYPPGTVLTTSTTTSSFIPTSVASAVPLNAKKVKGTIQAGSTASSALIFQVASDSSATSASSCVLNSAAAGNMANTFPLIPIKNQSVFYRATSTGGTPTFIIGITGYSI
ncbi:phage tail protein [Pantoea sp. SGAir0184]